MKLVILDRDGVINEEDPTIRVVTVKDFIPIDNSLAAIAKLKQSGYKVAVATNQSIISKNILTVKAITEIHNYLQDLLFQQYNVRLDLILYCPHKIEDGCNCRKPKPGMLLDIGKKFAINFNLTPTPFVGDSVSDLVAALAVGAVPVLVKTGKGIRSMLDPKITQFHNLLIFDNLNSFVNYWLKTH